MSMLELNRDLINANLNKPYEKRMALAIEYWFNEQGMFQSDRVCKLFSVNHNEFTIAVQKKISQMSGVEIKNEEPEVVVLFTKYELDRLFPKQMYMDLPFGLDFFDFIFANKYEDMRGKWDLLFTKKDLALIS